MKFYSEKGAPHENMQGHSTEQYRGKQEQVVMAGVERCNGSETGNTVVVPRTVRIPYFIYKPK